MGQLDYRHAAADNWRRLNRWSRAGKHRHGRPSRHARQARTTA